MSFDCWQLRNRDEVTIEKQSMISDYPYDSAVDPCEVDMDSSGVQKVSELFLHQQQNDLFTGGQMFVMRHGKVVLITCL